MAGTEYSYAYSQSFADPGGALEVWVPIQPPSVYVPGSVIVLKYITVNFPNAVDGQVVLGVQTGVSVVNGPTIYAWPAITSTSTQYFSAFGDGTSIYIDSVHPYFSVFALITSPGTVQIAYNYEVILPTDPTTGLSSPIVNNFLINYNDNTISGSTPTQLELVSIPSFETIIASTTVTFFSNDSSSDAAQVYFALLNPLSGIPCYLTKPILLSNNQTATFNTPIYLSDGVSPFQSEFGVYAQMSPSSHSGYFTVYISILLNNQT